MEGLFREISLVLFINMAKAFDDAGRILEVLSDPINSKINRVWDAGQVRGNIMTLHNGIQVYADSYGGFVKEILTQNRGVHEPQEEYVFDQVLSVMPVGATMIELGSFWAFYSLWFNYKVIDAKNYMIEPEPEYMKTGKQNFELNGRVGTFINAKVDSKPSDGVITVDSFIKENNLTKVNLLHSDIQGFELNMLNGAKWALKEKIIDFIFVSTHSNELHYKCLNLLKEHGYRIIASADFEKESYCYDGIIVATHLDDFPTFDIGKRETTD